MGARSNNPISAFLLRPPVLEGGVKLSARRDGPVGATVTLEHSGGTTSLEAAGLSVPYPSALRRLVADRPSTELVVVERIPKGLPDAAAAMGLSYIDLRGHGRLTAPGLVYINEPSTERGSEGRRKRAASSPFTAVAGRAIRALLEEPGRRWRVTDVAALADSNPGNVHRSLAALVELALVERDDREYRVVDPGALLEAWADRSPGPRREFTLAAGRSLRTEARAILDAVGGEGAVSGEFAAEQLAPYLEASSVIVHLFDEQAIARVPGAPGFREVETRGPALNAKRSITVRLTDSGVAAFGEKRGGLPLCSPQQIYFDLWREPGRGREAAEHLRKAVLRF